MLYPLCPNFQLNTFKTQQKVDILNSVSENTTRGSYLIRPSSCTDSSLRFQMFSFVHAQFTFFHQGFDLLRDLEPTMKTMAAQVCDL